MDITRAIIDKAVAAQPFGSKEPFLSGQTELVADFYKRIFSALEQAGVGVSVESDHYGSGYASYISAFVYRPDRIVDVKEFPQYTETTGLLLYLSRLAPIAVFGASTQSHSRDARVSSSGFITSENLNQLPSNDWVDFLSVVKRIFSSQGVEFLPTEPLLDSAPDGIHIPTVFNGPYYVFDALFYWED